MLRSAPLLLAVLLGASACVGAPAPADLDGIREVRADVERAAPGSASAAEARAVVEADLAFALRLYRQLAGSEQGNLFFSPYSISAALSMTLAGARAETAAQLAAALGVPFDLEAWHAGRNAIDLGLAAERPTIDDLMPLTLEPTNAVFGQRDFPFEDAYLRTLAEYYGAGLQAVDFASQPEACRQLINAWVNERTRERIPELLPEDAIDELTRLVLVNAIYFKANWINQFNPESTREQPFTRLDGSTIGAMLMHGSLRTDYARGDGWQAVRLPYAGNASMTVLVPDVGRFEGIEGTLDADFIAGMHGRLAEAMVNLGLPRWESASTINLVPHLEALGVSDLFRPGVADLTGIAPVDDLYVSAAVHQANVTVDETGTEAAAATAIVGGVTSAPALTVSLTVDRPFIYLISDDLTGELLFLGRVLDPTAG